VADTVAGNSPLALLYVEDEPTTRDLVCTLVRRKFPDIHVHTAANGREGLERFEEIRPDIVITDIKMPVMNGIEMARSIKSRSGSAPIIVTSAHSDMDYFIEAIEIGINHYVMKPIARDKLISAIEKCISAIMLERRVKEQADELAAANMELEAFNYTVAHDLRAPLTIISGYCQVLDELYGNKFDEQGKEATHSIHDGVRRMDSLIGALLKFSLLSHQELQRSVVDLSRVATDIASELRLRQPERRIVFNIAEGISCPGDPLLLGAAMENLLGNAWKYRSEEHTS